MLGVYSVLEVLMRILLLASLTCRQFFGGTLDQWAHPPCFCLLTPTALQSTQNWPCCVLRHALFVLCWCEENSETIAVRACWASRCKKMRAVPSNVWVLNFLKISWSCKVESVSMETVLKGCSVKPTSFTLEYKINRRVFLCVSLQSLCLNHEGDWGRRD